MKKIALVGCGRISKRHIEAIQGTAGVEVAAVCDIDERKAAALSEVLQVPYVTDYKKLRDVDAAAVLTPSGNHPLHAAEIAEHTDIPNIIVEKSLDLTKM